MQSQHQSHPLSITQPSHVYIGSYSASQKQPSLYDLVTKDMTVLKINMPVVNPSYVLCRNGHTYFVQECNNGRLSVIDSEYNLLQTVFTNGNDPCHIAMNDDGTLISVTNYSSGSFIVFSIKDNKFSKLFSFVMHEGSSVNPDRQESPHPHSSIFVKNGNTNFLFVSDLGTDIVYWYNITDNGLVCEKEKCIKMVGCGPRHLALDGNGRKLLYLTGQLDSSIRVLSYQTGKLQLLSAYRVSSNPTNYPSEVKFYNNTVWMANRGDNYMIIFDIPTSGTLKEKFRFKVGQWPRHFNISKLGTIYVACQYENLVERYRYETGKVFMLGSFKISSPSCINFEE